MEKPEAEVFDVPGATVEVTSEAPPAEAPKAKAAKPKKEITAERKQQLLEQLKRGRETAAKNRAAKKAAKSKVTKESEAAASAPQPAKPAADKPAPTNTDNHSSVLASELKLLRAELAETRREKRERQAAKRQAEREAKKAASAPAPEPKEEAPTVVAPPAVQFYWDARTGKRVARR